MRDASGREEPRERETRLVHRTPSDLQESIAVARVDAIHARVGVVAERQELDRVGIETEAHTQAPDDVVV